MQAEWEYVYQKLPLSRLRVELKSTCVVLEIEESLVDPLAALLAAHSAIRKEMPQVAGTRAA